MSNENTKEKIKKDFGYSTLLGYKTPANIKSFVRSCIRFIMLLSCACAKLLGRLKPASNLFRYLFLPESFTEFGERWTIILLTIIVPFVIGWGLANLTTCK